MTEPVSNARAAIESELQCWHCHAVNLPNATPYIVCDLRAGTASCDVCGASGAIAAFQAKPRPEGDQP